MEGGLYMGFLAENFTGLFYYLPDEMKVALLGLIAFLIGLAVVRIVL